MQCVINIKILMRSFMFFTIHIKSSKSSVCFTFIVHLNQGSTATWAGPRALEPSSSRILSPLPGLREPLLSLLQGPRGTKEQLFEKCGGTA